AAINSCTPDEPITPIVDRELGPYYMGEFLWYVYFDEGTEWVYKGKNERGKTVYDTVRVTSSTLDTVRCADGEPNHWKVTRQYVNYAMTSSFFRTEIYHNLRACGGILNFVDTSHQHRMILDRLVWSEGQIVGFFTDREGMKSYDVTTYEGLQNGIKAGGKTYDNVAVFYVKDDASWDWDGWPSRYYWAKNVGIIKRVNYNKVDGTAQWELVSYKVNQ
ncbi:MAG: hypothetical protein ACPGLV_10220, partial [Bacteroidia bacterium]